MSGETFVLLLSILGLLATLFLYKLGTDARKNRLKKQLISFKERLYKAILKRWK